MLVAPRIHNLRWAFAAAVVLWCMSVATAYAADASNRVLPEQTVNEGVAARFMDWAGRPGLTIANNVFVSQTDAGLLFPNGSGNAKLRGNAADASCCRSQFAVKFGTTRPPITAISKRTKCNNR